MNFEEYKKIQEAEHRQSDKNLKVFTDREIDSVARLKDYFKGKVLEVGCGHGYASLEIDKLGYDVVGLDLLEYRVEETRKKYIPAVIGTMEELPFENKSFDTGFYSHVLEHAFDFNKAVSEAKRVCKRLIIIVPIESIDHIRSHTARIESPDVIRKSFLGKILFEDSWCRLGDEFAYVVDLEG